MVDADTLNSYMRYYSAWLGLPADFLLALAVHESSYDPLTGYYRNVRNIFGASGLMQLKPIGLSDIYQRWNIAIDPSEPVQAVVGASLMTYLNRAYIAHSTGTAPSVAGLVVAYNGGWTAGKKYELTGIAPTRETKMYLARVGSYLGIA